jgi:hypothetical protein
VRKDEYEQREKKLRIELHSSTEKNGDLEKENAELKA